MFDHNRRKILIGSLLMGAALSTPVLAFAEDRYQVLMRLQQDVLQTLHHCTEAGRAHNFEIGFDEKNERYLSALKDWKVRQSLGNDEFRKLDAEISKANAFMSETRRANWKISDGDQKVQVLLTFLLTEFNRSDLSSASVQQGISDLMRGKIQIDTMDPEQLRLVEDAVVSVAIVKSLLSYHRIPMDTQKMPAFHEFAGRYRNLILS